MSAMVVASFESLAILTSTAIASMCLFTLHRIFDSNLAKFGLAAAETETHRRAAVKVRLE